MKEESELRYETKENLAKPPSPPYPVFTLDWLSLLPLFLLLSLPLSLFIASSSPSEDPEEKGSASAWLTDEPF